jgi:hypothetical protein
MNGLEKMDEDEHRRDAVLVKIDDSIVEGNLLD